MQNEMTQKGNKLLIYSPFALQKQAGYPLYSSETDNFFLPLALRDANTLRPFADSILFRNPCLFFLFLLEG
jgi:hypothetical protein